MLDIFANGGERSPQVVCQNESFLANYYAREGNVYYQSIFAALTASRLRADLGALGYAVEEAEDPSSGEETTP